MEVEKEYNERYENYLKPLANKIQYKLEEDLESVPRIDRVYARAKSPLRFIDKAKKVDQGVSKYNDPLTQIQDQIGARVVVFYTEDIKCIESEIEGYYRFIEKKDLIPESEYEFGYIGKHYVLMIPEDVIDADIDRGKIPKFFELQIKTLFQHAWSEANHDLGYKPEQKLTSHQKRKLAFTAAQAWGADQIFLELSTDLNA